MKEMGGGQNPEAEHKKKMKVWLTAAVATAIIGAPLVIIALFGAGATYEYSRSRKSKSSK